MFLQIIPQNRKSNDGDKSDTAKKSHNVFSFIE